MEALAQSSRISFAIGASTHALVNKFRFDPGELIAPIHIFLDEFALKSDYRTATR